MPQQTNWEAEYRAIQLKTIEEIKDECKKNSFDIAKLKATLSTILYVAGPIGSIIISLLTAYIIKWLKL